MFEYPRTVKPSRIYQYPLMRGQNTQIESEIRIPFNWWFWSLLALHIPLGYLARETIILPTIHALLIAVIGSFYLLREASPRRLALSAGYIAGAEVFWRMTEATVFHEYAKYLIAFLFLLAIVKWRIHPRIAPILYLSLLFVSIPLSFNVYSLETVRSQISAVLSGPLALAVCVIFFSSIRFSYRDLHLLFRALLLPIMSISAVILSNISSFQVVMFRNASNFTTSGGFGPNQVSAVLGLGCLACWLILMLSDLGKLERLLFLGLSIFWFGQTLLTFSRGGVLNIIAATLLAMPLLISSGPGIRRFLAITLIFIPVALWIVFPYLNRFSGNMLQTRIQDLDMTTRIELASADLAVWRENPIFGVGPGSSNIYRAPLFRGIISAAHTEYSRMLAEHGLFGFVSLLFMIGMAIQKIFQTRNRIARGTVIALLAWSFLEMTHAAMRISATSFIYGLAFTMISDHPSDDATAVVDR
jgi:O-antigen ligase